MKKFLWILAAFLISGGFAFALTLQVEELESSGSQKVFNFPEITDTVDELNEATQPGDLGTAAAEDVGYFATAAQGSTADTATQPADLGTAAAEDVGYFATAAQGSTADTATQPGDLGTAAAEDVGYFATAAQGSTADTATQPGDLGTAAAEDVGYFATAAQGSTADTATQPGDLGTAAAEDVSYITSRDTVVSNAFVAADTVVSNAVTSAFGSADTVVSNAAVAADTVVSNAFVAADTVVSNASVSAVASAFNDLRTYLADGLLIDGTLAITTPADQFKTTSTAVYTISGVTYTKAATDTLEFSAANTINTGGAATEYWGIWLVQINAAGDVSTKPGGGSADQLYESAELAIAALPAVDASNVSLGYILVDTPVSTPFTCNTTDLTGLDTYSDTQVKALPAAL